MTFKLISQNFKNNLLKNDPDLWPLFDHTVFNDNNKIIYIEKNNKNLFTVGVIYDIINYEGDDENYEFTNLYDLKIFLKNKFNLNYFILI